MITKEHLFYAFSKENDPVLRVKSGERITLETVDAFGGQVTSELDKLDQLDWSKVNPATGPVYVEGAMPGDLLKVDIEAIQLENQGVMASVPEAGLFGNIHKNSTIKLFNIEGDRTFLNDIEIPIEPMIGVIGVAPERPIPNGEPGAHGGNMDNKRIGVGTTLYLPIVHEGAYFGLGDLHAAMGDGEVNVTGIEIGGKVTVTLSVVKGLSHGHPILVDQTSFYTIYSDDTLDLACQGVSEEMHYWLKRALDYNDSDAAMLMSLMADLEVCQVVDPKLTMRMKMPKAYFKSVFK